MTMVSLHLKMVLQMPFLKLLLLKNMQRLKKDKVRFHLNLMLLKQQAI